jgi:predicted N-acyltransferase
MGIWVGAPSLPIGVELRMFRTELVDGIAQLPKGAWDALVVDQSPFLEWDWLASLEEAGAVGSGTGWTPQPLVVRDGEKLVAACPLYRKEHSEGEFVFDFTWADAAMRAGIPYYPKLLVGVPFTPVTGNRFLVAPGADRPALIRILGNALRKLCLGERFSSVHINFCREDEVTALLGDTPEVQARDKDFLLRVGFQYHWRNEGFETFDDYLARFRSKRRNQIKRERRAMEQEGISIETLTGDAIDDSLFEIMFECYLTTVKNHTWGRVYLNLRFFELLRERFKNRLCFVVARRGAKIIAGTTNVARAGALYGRYWGALQNTRFLHFNVCYYAAIEHCIATGIQRFEPGAGGDYKYLRGFDPQPTYSLHFLAEPRLAQAVSRFLHAERTHAHRIIDHLHEHSALTPPRQNGR